MSIGFAMPTAFDFTQALVKKLHNVPQWHYTIIKTFPLPHSLFIEGLFYQKPFLYISNGNVKQSSVIKYNVDTQTQTKKILLPPRIFAEGLTIIHKKLYQLGLNSKAIFIYNKNLSPIGTQALLENLWGLTHIGNQLIVSNGSNELLFFNSQHIRMNTLLFVHYQNQPFNHLNALGYDGQYLFANVYYRNIILVISPKNGKVIAWINITKLWQAQKIKGLVCVANGIAFDKNKNQYIFAGKNWKMAYIVKLVTSTRKH